MFFSRAPGLKYVDRGNLGSYDYEIGDFVTDNSWRDLDISAIVGARTLLVMFNLAITNAAAGQTADIRTKGFTSVPNMMTRRTQAPTVAVYTDSWVMTDANGIIQYRINNTAWTLIRLNIRGWFVL